MGARTSPQSWITKPQRPNRDPTGWLREDEEGPQSQVQVITHGGAPPGASPGPPATSPRCFGTASTTQPGRLKPVGFLCSEVKRVEKGWASSYRVLFFFFFPLQVKTKIMTLGGDQFEGLSSQTKISLPAKSFLGLTVWGRKLRKSMKIKKKKFLGKLDRRAQAKVTLLVKYFST